MIETVVQYLSHAFLIIGVLFVFLGVTGLFRFPDFYTRIHAASVTDSAGAGFFIIGLALQTGLDNVTLKLGFILLFSFFTAPTGSHAVANSAVRFGLRPWTRQDKNKEQP